MGSRVVICFAKFGLFVSLVIPAIFSSGLAIANSSFVAEILSESPTQKIADPAVASLMNQMSLKINSGELGTPFGKNISLPVGQSYNWKNPEYLFYSPCIFNCSKYADNLNDLWAGLTSVYFILKQSYGLSGNTVCSNYSSVDWSLLNGFEREKPYSDIVFRNFGNTSYPELGIFKLGSYDPQLVSIVGTLPHDVYQDLKAMALLAYPEVEDAVRQEYREDFRNRHRFIKKSCGDNFIKAYDAFLNDYSLAWTRRFELDSKRVEEQNALALAKSQAEEKERVV